MEEKKSKVGLPPPPPNHMDWVLWTWKCDKALPAVEEKIYKRYLTVEWCNSRVT
jgi:hypothetical protein